MVAVSDFVEDYCGEKAKSSARVKRTFWGYLIEGDAPEDIMKPIIRVVGIVSGTAFVFAFVGLWTLPGSSVDGDLLPFKLALSAFWLLLGVFLIQLCEEKGKLEIEVDKLRQEMRAVERGKDGMTKIIDVVPFREIGEVVMEGEELAVYSQAGDQVARFPLKRKGKRRQRKAA